MPTLSITKSYSNGNPLTAAMLDDIVNGVQTFLNTTKIDATNIQSAAITQACLASGAVGSSQIAAGAVGATQKAALNYVLSASTSNYSTASSSYQAVVTTGSLATSGRPVVVAVIHDASANQGYLGGSRSSFLSTIVDCQIVRDPSGSNTRIWGTTIESTPSPNSGGLIIAGQNRITVPVGVYAFDAPSAGTYTYQLQIKCTAADSAYVYYAKVLAFEL